MRLPNSWLTSFADTLFLNEDCGGSDTRRTTCKPYKIGCRTPPISTRLRLIVRLSPGSICDAIPTIVTTGCASAHGRDHHPRCFTAWLAGAGIKPGITYGETDDFSYNVVKDPVPVRDFNATLLHCMGIDHNKLTFKFQGLDQKLTSTVPASVVNGLLSA